MSNGLLMICSQCKGSGFIAPLGFMAKSCPKCKAPQPLFLNTLNLLDEHKVYTSNKPGKPDRVNRARLVARVAEKRLKEQQIGAR